MGNPSLSLSNDPIKSQTILLCCLSLSALKSLSEFSPLIIAMSTLNFGFKCLFVVLSRLIQWFSQTSLGNHQ